MLCLCTWLCVFNRWCVHMFVCGKYMIIIKKDRMTGGREGALNTQS